MDKIKEVWGNGKNRGIIILCLYFLLFAYIFMAFGGRQNKVILPEKPPLKEETKKITSYEYEYVFNDSKVKIVKYNDIVNFKIDDIDYYYINSECYKLEEEKLHKVENPLQYNFDFLGTISELKGLSTLEKTSNYANGMIEEVYNINYAQFMNFYGITDADAEQMTNYSIFYENDSITKIVFNTLNVEINYLNLENIEEIIVNYEFYKEGVEE